MASVIRNKLKSTNGWNIPYICNVSEKHRRILLCLHGFAGDKDSSVIAALMESLDEKGIGVVTFDWPAHGESDAPDDALTVENCLSDLNNVVSWLSQNWDIPVACFATSFGGYLATLYRNGNPEVFTDLILRSPALKMHEIFRSLITDEDFTEMMQGKPVIQGFDRKMKIGISFYESLCNHDVYSQTPPHHENVLIIQGDADSIVNPKDTMDYARRNGISIVLFEGTDHVYKRSGEKERIISETGKFLLRKRDK